MIIVYVGTGSCKSDEKSSIFCYSTMDLSAPGLSKEILCLQPIHYQCQVIDLVESNFEFYVLKGDEPFCSATFPFVNTLSVVCVYFLLITMCRT